LVSVLSEKPDRSEAPTRVWSNITHVGAIPVYTTATEKAEAEFVVATIERLIGGTGFFSIDSGRACGAQDSEVDSLSDIVVLVRLRAQLPALEEAFFRSSLPYETATADRCLDPAAALTVAALRLVLRRNSRLARFAFLRTAAATLNAQAANGETKSGRRQSFSLQQLWAWAALPDFDAGLPAVFSPFVDALPAIAQTVGSGENGGAATGSAPGRGGRVMRAVEVCLKRFCLQCGQQAQARRARTQLGGPAVAAGDDLCGFVFRTDLRGGQDLFDPRAERVHLMTLHAAKGLEFPFVFMVGLNDGILPYRHRADVEEERRLFYVGMTRASTRLFFSFSKKRWLFGERLPETVSPFVAELGTTLCEQMTSALPKTKNRDSGQTQLSLF
jgi:DNA helicase-2/ATP-dependent DNA helicase PcrA